MFSEICRKPSKRCRKLCPRFFELLRQKADLRYNTTGYVLLHKANANWCYLIIAELRPLYDSIPINLRTGSQAELGKKRESVSEASRAGPGGEKMEGDTVLRFDAPAIFSTRRLGARAQLLLKLTNQKPAGKLETEPSIDATLFFSYSSSITEHHFLNSRDMILTLAFFFLTICITAAWCLSVLKVWSG